MNESRCPECGHHGEPWDSPMIGKMCRCSCHPRGSLARDIEQTIRQEVGYRQHYLGSPSTAEQREEMRRTMDALDVRLAELDTQLQLTERKLSGRDGRVQELQMEMAIVEDKLASSHFAEMHVAAAISSQRVASHGAPRTRQRIVKRAPEELSYDDGWDVGDYVHPGWRALRSVGLYIHPGWGIGLRRAWRGLRAIVRGTGWLCQYVGSHAWTVVLLVTGYAIGATLLSDVDTLWIVIAAGGAIPALYLLMRALERM